MLEFKKKFSMQNGNKVTKKNWNKVVAKSFEPCTTVRGVPEIDKAIKENGAYYEMWKLHYEKDKGFIFLEVNHKMGISGYHKTVKDAIWSAINNHIRVYLED